MATSLVGYDVHSDSDNETGVEGSGQVIVLEKPQSTGMLSTLALPQIDPTPLVPVVVHRECFF